MEAGSITFLGIRLLRWGLAELACGIGNLFPSPLGPGLWKLALHLNPHHEVAASNRALVLLDRGHPEAWPAFQVLLDQLANPEDTSASDLHLSRTPGRVLRRLAARWLWGPSATDMQGPHDRSLQETCAALARKHTHRWLEAGDLETAARALDAWHSVAGESPETSWAAAEIDWRRGEDSAAGLETAAPLISAGIFVSPLDTLPWARRSLRAEHNELAATCLALARRWVPEEAETWRLDALLADSMGDIARARESRERALALDPQDVETFLRSLEAATPMQSAEGRLELDAPDAVDLGDRATLRIRLHSSRPGSWVLYLLPPPGHGLRAPRAPLHPAPDGTWTAEIEACRGDRVRGGPWPLVALALESGGHVLEARCEISVVERSPGRVLLTVTEDHEIQEERGTLSAPALHRLLVDKSHFASQLGPPWTHMVEVGSTLDMTDWAAASEPPSESLWKDLRQKVRQHLAEEVRNGNDLQPHLHTFNDSAYPHFAYRSRDGGWQPTLRFLLTGAERRGDWASVCRPANHGRSEASDRTFPDRLESVARAVAQIEEIGRLGSPDFRPTLWRSGLLEYGDSPSDRAWSAVALRRAGILADSDLNKPGSRAGAVPPAFLAGWHRPFEPRPGGPLLQLPIVANLEGDYLMGSRALERRVDRCLEAIRHNGQPAPGVHLFTVLTHDKFINARRGREELRLDSDYGDWRTIRRHLDAWRRAGAEQVTAARGVELVIDDLTWQPVPWLDHETFVLSSPEVRFRLRVLGRAIPVDESQPQHLLVPVPCSLREGLREVLLASGDEVRNQPFDPGAASFWWRRLRAEPTTVHFRLDTAPGPRLLELERSERDQGWNLRLGAEEPFLDARVLLPWKLGPFEPGDYRVADLRGNSTVEAHAEDEGLLLTGLRFPGDEPVLDLELSPELGTASSSSRAETSEAGS